jgi:predicted RNase H-like nuclease (RuvC/YqgF family)
MTEIQSKKNITMLINQLDLIKNHLDFTNKMLYRAIKDICVLKHTIEKLKKKLYDRNLEIISLKNDLIMFDSFITSDSD